MEKLQIIFKGKCISKQMAPEAVVEKIPNLLISTNDSGNQDHKTLLAAYSKLDQYLETNNLKHPVVVVVVLVLVLVVVIVELPYV